MESLFRVLASVMKMTAAARNGKPNENEEKKKRERRGKEQSGVLIKQDLGGTMVDQAIRTPLAAAN